MRIGLAASLTHWPTWDLMIVLRKTMERKPPLRFLAVCHALKGKPAKRVARRSLRPSGRGSRLPDFALVDLLAGMPALPLGAVF